MNNRAIVYAIHNFEAENEDEINFLIGEPITILEKDEKYLDGWWQGMNLRGETGLFPMNYTSPEKPIVVVDNLQNTVEQFPHPPLPQQQHQQQQALQPPSSQSTLPQQQQQQQQQQSLMPSPHLSSRSSGSTIEDEIDNALFQLQIAAPSTKQQELIEAEITTTTPSAAAVSLMNTNHMNMFNDHNRIENWDVEQVADWLISVGLDSVSDNFIDQEITGDILLDLNIEALKELGITTFGKRYKVMQAITLLKEESSTSVVSSDYSNGTSTSTSATTTEKPTPNTSVSTSAISRPTSRKSIPSSLRRSNSQTNSMNTNESGDVLYQFPRKAPLPPGFNHHPSGGNNEINDSSSSNIFLSPPARPQQQPSSSSDVIIRPISPQSLNSSSNVSRSNTFNTVSSSGASVTDPKGGFQSPRRVLSQKSQQTFDSLGDKDLSTSNNININNFQASTTVTNKNNNDWNNMMSSESIHPTPTTKTSSVIHPLNTPTTSTSTPREPMQISNVHKLSVSSFDENRSSTTEAFQAPEHEGWLHKQSDKYKTWNKRWFVLKGSNLFYFKSPKDVRMKGIINLRGYKIIVDETIHAGKYCFKAQHERERTFFFYTDTEESMRVWLKMLMKTTIARDFRAPVMSSNHIATVSLDVARRMRPRPPSVIMYKNQKQLKGTNGATITTNDHPNHQMMGMLEEEEETQNNNYIPIQQQQQEEQQQPTISHYRSESVGMKQEQQQEQEQELPSHYPNIHHILNDEEEDLIDPQHRSLPLGSSLSITSSLSNNSTSGDEWGISQYINWINSYLPAGKKAIDLTSAFRNGDTLITLLETISGKEVRRPPVQKGGSMSVMMLDNIVAAFKFMGREGVEVDGRYTIKDVFGGNELKIIIMLDAIKAWADTNYSLQAVTNDAVVPHKKSDTSVLIGKNSGWRGSAMMDQASYS